MMACSGWLTTALSTLFLYLALPWHHGLGSNPRLCKDGKWPCSFEGFEEHVFGLGCGDLDAQELSELASQGCL